MQLVIRPEIPADYPTVFEVHRQAFEDNVEARLVEALRQEPDHIPDLSLVAAWDDSIVGHIIFSPVVILGMQDRWRSSRFISDAVLARHSFDSASMRVGDWDTAA